MLIFHSYVLGVIQVISLRDRRGWGQPDPRHQNFMVSGTRMEREDHHAHRPKKAGHHRNERE